MKRLALACLAGVLWVYSVFAVPTFTPTIDGTKDAGWGATPDESSTTQRLPAEFNLDGGLYVTDDNTSLYFGFDADNDPLVDGRTPHIHIVFDIGSTAAGGNSGCWGAGGVSYGFTYLPEYDVVMQWNTDNESAFAGFTGLNRWDGFWNQLTELTQDAGGGNSWTELAIPKTLIGLTSAGTVLNVSMWLRPHWDCVGSNACLPADADFPIDNCGGGGGAFNSQFVYTTQVAFGESDPPGISLLRQIDRDEIELQFDEPMNQTTLQNIANYTPTGPGAWSIASPVSYVTPTTVGLRCNFNFIEGTGYSVLLGSGITDVAGNSIDPNADDAAWTAIDYGDLVVVVQAPAVYTCIKFKGSFNFYHEYDASWSGGSHQMYDNGLNGDTTAGDHRHTIVFPLVPTATTFEWGAETCASQWLIQGPNRTATVPDGGQHYAFYEVPDVTTAPCDVTFRCDMQFINDTWTSVNVAGGFNGWPYPGAAMTDGDLDEQWTATITIPAGSPRHQEFKFQYADGDPDQEWEGAPNRTFDIVGAPATLDLPNMFFSDYLADPYQLTVLDNGTDVRLRWNEDYVRVNFEVFSHSSVDSIMENGSSLGTTSSTFMDTPHSAAKTFFQVRTVAP